MRNIRIKTMLLGIIVIAIAMFIPNMSKAAFVSISASKTNANPGETISVTISSDSVGRVNLSVSNGTLSANRVWMEGASQTVNVTVGPQGTTTVTATPEGGQMSNNKSDVPVAASSVNISINSNNNSGNNSGTTKSNNANLGNLGIKPNDFSGFRAAKTSYDVTVPNNVSSINVYANKGHSGQTISGTGNKTLTEGENAFNVTVTAEDGTTKKIYTINIRRKAKDETTNTEESEDTTDNTENGEEQPKEVFGLSELGITGFDLDPEFKTDIFEYKLQLKEDKDKLDIITVATEANSNITITGNENLKNGENIITILVTNETGDKTATYQITVNKDIETKDNTIAEEQERIQQEKQKKIIILSASAAFVVIVGVIAIIVIIKKSKASTVQIPYSNLYDKDEEENDGYVENPIDYNKYNLNQEKSEEQIKNTEENEFDYENQYKDEFDYENQEENRKNRHRKGKRFK